MRSSLIAATTLGLVVVLASPAIAGRIFGDITVDGKTAPAGLKLKVSQPGTTAIADTTETDKFGSFKLMVKTDGKCTLTVLHDKQALELAVFSNKAATRYDLVLEKKDGKTILRRK